MNDAEIIERVIAGDTKAFELLVLKYQSQIFYTTYNIVKNREYAEDITQDVFLKCYEKLDTIQNREQFPYWIKRIAINLSINHYERAKRIVDVETEDSDYNYFDSISTDECPEDFILKDELRKYVRLFVDALPDRLRTIVILREVEDLSYEEIAELLKIPLGTVRSRLFKARQIIKERLIKQGLTNEVFSEAN